MSEETNKIKVIKPQPGFQDRFTRSNLDVVFGGGSMNSGKTFGTILSIAEPILDPNFRAVFLRRTLQETKVAGGMLQDLKKVFNGYYKSVKESENPRMTFPSGAFVDLTHISNEDPQDLIERIKGWQYDLIYFDEGTSYAWSTFRLLFSRNRGTAKWTNKIRLTCNPKRNHWLRIFLKDYIGPDGYIRPGWDGRIRYFYIKGKTVESVVWGDSKREVYMQCKREIDEALGKFKEQGITYEALIKSFTFYLGSTSENKASIGKNSGYLGSVAAMGEVERKQNLLGNWDVIEEDLEQPITTDAAESVFMNDAQKNNDMYITADLADTGTDNTVILAWDGLHIIDIAILCKSLPRRNCEKMLEMAKRYDISKKHIIYDGIRAAYVKDYIPEADAFLSYNRPYGLYGRLYKSLKDESYARLIEVIKRRMLSFADNVWSSPYKHAKLKVPIFVKDEFIQECLVVRFKDCPGGKKALLTKKEMNAMLGKERSMDLLDPIAMRMKPLCEYEYGEELRQTIIDVGNDMDIYGTSIYDECFWA